MQLSDFCFGRSSRDACTPVRRPTQPSKEQHFSSRLWCYCMGSCSAGSAPGSLQETQLNLSPFGPACAQVQAAMGGAAQAGGRAQPSLIDARSLLLQRDFYLFTAERLASAQRDSAASAPVPALALA